MVQIITILPTNQLFRIRIIGGSQGFLGLQPSHHHVIILHITMGGALATVEVVKEKCGDVMEEAATAVKGGCRKVMAETGDLWWNFGTRSQKDRSEL